MIVGSRQFTLFNICLKLNTAKLELTTYGKFGLATKNNWLNKYGCCALSIDFVGCVTLKLPITLHERNITLTTPKMALKFAKKSLKQESFSKLFPLNTSKHIMAKRSPEKYVVKYINSERYRKSAVPYLQRLLNKDYSKQKKDLKNLLQVNNDIVHNIPITY